MESVGAISEGEWNSSFNGMCSEEADFMAQLLGNCSLPGAAVSCFWSGNESNVKNLEVEESSMYSSQETNASMFSFSLGNSNIFPSFPNNNSLMAMDYCMIDGKNNVMEGDDFLNQDASNDSVASDDKLQQESFKEDKLSSPSEISKKRPRIPAESQRSKRLKKYVDENDDSNNTTTTTTTTTSTTNVVLHRQSSSGCCSEDDSYGMNSSSSSKKSGAQNFNGKTRASRGSATDPQSLYARKRRERINERLKVLQNLVPNGTKVDISTMLEEAVLYVKFLQLQIKLLSSDDLWMYAPIAYNGMDLGLDLKIPSLNPQS